MIVDGLVTNVKVRMNGLRRFRPEPGVTYIVDRDLAMAVHAEHYRTGRAPFDVVYPDGWRDEHGELVIATGFTRIV